MDNNLIQAALSRARQSLPGREIIDLARGIRQQTGPNAFLGRFMVDSETGQPPQRMTTKEALEQLSTGEASPEQLSALSGLLFMGGVQQVPHRTGLQSTGGFQRVPRRSTATRDPITKELIPPQGQPTITRGADLSDEAIGAGGKFTNKAIEKASTNAQKYRVPQESMAMEALKSGVPADEVAEKFGIGAFQQADQRLKGLGLLADYENALNVGDSGVAKQILEAIRTAPKSSPLSEYASIVPQWMKLLPK